MSRYAITPINKTSTGKRVVGTTILTAPTPNAFNDVYIRTTSIERLDKLAVDFYNDASLWWVIAAANNLGKGTIVVPQNTAIRIPAASQVNEFLTQTNRNR
jgi:hypothetical protein